MSVQRALGVDLGTTNTLVAETDARGRTDVLLTREGAPQIPSIVLFSEERTIVGEEARLRGRRHPDRLAACAKQSLGRPAYSHLIAGESFPPEVIQACVLRAVHDEWLRNVSEPTGVVIAVPARFREPQRHATAMAAEIAGLHLLDLINEPVAVALAFGEHLAWMNSSGGSPTYHVLVFDLGGYTFEATLLQVSSGRITMVATEHDLSLGGHQWDLRLAELLAAPLVRKQGADPRATPDGLEYLLQLAKQVKHELTDRAAATAQIAWGGASATVEITRAEFEQRSAELVARAMSVCERVLRRGKLAWTDLRRVLLSGGATRLQALREALAAKHGREPDDQVTPEEAVARGAAVYAANLLRAGGAPVMEVTNVSTHSLGLEGIDLATGRHVNKVLIPRGTRLPARVARDFVTRSNAQRTISFNVLEGDEDDPARCVHLGKIFLRDLPADMSDHWPVEIVYELGADGRIRIEARIRYTEMSVQLETVRAGVVSHAHVAHWQAPVQARAGLAKFREVLGWTRAADAPPPVLLVGLGETNAAEPAQGFWAFLSRVMPFAFGPREPAAAAEPAQEQETGGLGTTEQGDLPAAKRDAT